MGDNLTLNLRSLMNEYMRRALKVLGYGIIWVFVLSIRIQGRTIFHYANNILVQNRIVAAIDETLSDGVDAVFSKVSNSFNSLTGNEKKI
ncbi:MAG: hypothetical protein NT027_00350 [Proteobacteria bacterium]|nr:hypothetical protein [Pseudomonadota bacterium]